MSVPPGTLTDEYRDAVLEFYGTILGWREIDALRLPDRMTISVGSSFYVNVRERDDPATFRGYDHFGVLVRSAEELHELWRELDANYPEVRLDPVSDIGGALTFRMQHLLPLAVEVQYFPTAS
jgi:hypothetical protein